jgi:dTMP kinase
MNGKFIVFEGGDGAGKDTQIDLLKSKLPAERVVFTREPGGTPLGKELRRLLLERKQPVDDAAEIFMFLADRAQHMAELVEPSVEKGLTVISNRSWFSFVAYQIYGRQQQRLLPLAELAFAEVYKNKKPDLIVYLDVPVEVGLARSAARGKMNALDKEPEAFHRRLRDGFERVFKDVENVWRVDGTRPIEEIHAEILPRIQSLVGVA